MGAGGVHRRGGGGRLALQRSLAALLCAVLPLLAGCATGRKAAAPRPESELPAGAEAWSLFGEPLFPPALDRDTRRGREKHLAEARERFESTPDDPDAVIWLGRRTAYLGRYREAIGVFSAGIERFPSEPRLFRHRGHRFITIRRFDAAIADLETAARLVADRPDEVEPDGLPNARNVPTSTLHSNIWYHLGLARYLTGDFEGALAAYRECEKFSTNPDMQVATTNWLSMTLRRLGRKTEAAAALAPIFEGMDIIENHDYHRLLLVAKGNLPAEELLAEAADSRSPVMFATVGYGIGNRHLVDGRRRDAVALFRRVIAGGSW
ncbi:MAG TPA: tetratricopeptide repeat protein, partial [Thermoanaerobaculia bacterium]|nr:tetratricopeptide repeat protein [Thermoanaerobaculia bacterium]